MSTPYQNILVLLAKSDIEYLVAGGFAVNFHNINRMTLDLDLIVHLTEANVIKFDELMTGLGFRPKVPVSGKDFAKAENRKLWIEEKNMIVFSYTDPNNPIMVIDVFVKEPKPFAEMNERRVDVDLYGAKLRVVGLQDLLDMKLTAARPKDQYDILMIQEKLKKQPIC